MIPTRLMPMGRGGKRLPYDAEVEYLESTGTQYVDTGVVGGSATKVRIVAASPNVSVYASLFGARQGSDNRPSFCIWQRTAISEPIPGIRFDYNDPTTTSTIGVRAWQTNATNEIVKSGPRNYVNGVEVPENTTHSFALEFPFFLFNVNGGGTPTAYPFIGSVYECQIWDADGILVRDYVPVRVGQVGYLFDRVSGQLFGNAGTGALVLGPDK